MEGPTKTGPYVRLGEQLPSQLLQKPDIDPTTSPQEMAPVSHSDQKVVEGTSLAFRLDGEMN